MKIVSILALLAAGAAGCLFLKESGAEQEDSDELSGQEATAAEEIGGAFAKGAQDAPAQCSAVVEDACRAMDIITLQGASRVTFRTADGQKRKYLIPGEGGLHLRPGDEGTLEYHGQTFISFTKESGEIVGALYYIPAEDTEE